MELYEYEALNDRWQQERGCLRAASEEGARAALRDLRLRMARIWPAWKSPSMFSKTPARGYYPSDFRPARPVGDTWVYTTQSIPKVIAGLGMLALAGTTTAVCLAFFPPPAVPGVAWMLFALGYTLWENRLTVSRYPGRLLMVNRVGPYVVSRTEIRADDAEEISVQTVRYFEPGFGHRMAVGVMWRWQVSVYVVRKDGSAYQVDHSSDYEFERSLAQRLSESLGVPIEERVAPEAIEPMGRYKRLVPWLLALWILLMLVLLGFFVHSEIIARS